MDIGPGDWVECVDASDSPHHLLSCPLVLGAMYLVVELHPEDAAGEVGVETRSIPERIFRASRFRPIYRPKESLIQTLLEPVDEMAPA